MRPRRKRAPRCRGLQSPKFGLGIGPNRRARCPDTRRDENTTAITAALALHHPHHQPSKYEIISTILKERNLPCAPCNSNELRVNGVGLQTGYPEEERR